MQEPLYKFRVNPSMINETVFINAPKQPGGFFRLAINMKMTHKTNFPL